MLVHQASTVGCHVQPSLPVTTTLAATTEHPNHQTTVSTDSHDGQPLAVSPTTPSTFSSTPSLLRRPHQHRP
ncbi:hypothetical protein EUGRSUZ_I02149 [Eucalyptus grandis]|uniref:Uncharacterized protein n=2 Tax=Eucalyptus grandis TaxID=71139 RepID=A0ACC3JHV5_EUCGR|nr:hypothetical protein EUGRSUZ_I02149 [Eucalyptus grandis]